MATKDAGTVGERAFALLRGLTIYALLIAVPVAAYYYAVIDRQARARSELGFHALKRLQSEFDTRIERLESLSRSLAPVVKAGEKSTDATSAQDQAAKEQAAVQAELERLRYSEVGVRVAERTPTCPKPTEAVPIRNLETRASQSLVHLRHCGRHLEMQAEQLLDAPAALRRFERVALADEDGKVIVSLTPPLDDDPDHLVPRAATSTATLTSLRPFLLQATRDRIEALAGKSAKDAAPEKGREADVGEPAELTATIAESRYRIYLLPFVPEKALRRGAPAPGDEAQAVDAYARLYLVGIERQSALDDATAALGSEGMWYLIVALLLTLAAWPLLRVLLLSEHEAVSRSGLAATLISLIFVPALITIALLGYMARGKELADGDQRAGRYAEAIGTQLELQLVALLRSIDRLAPNFDSERVGKPADDSGLRLLQCHDFAIPGVAADGFERCHFEKEKNPVYCHAAPSGLAATALRPPLDFDSLFAADAGGRIKDSPHLTAGGCQPRAAEIDLSGREYFRALARGQGWPLPEGYQASPGSATAVAGQFIAQRIYSRADGTRTLVVAVPRRVNDHFAGVYGAVSTVRALSAAIQPPQLGFAVVDPLSGAVLFHSDDDNSLHENFFDETGDDAELIAALRASRPQTVHGHYRGLSQHFVTRPLKGMPWTVVSWHDSAATALPATTASLIAAIELICQIAVLVLLGAALVLIAIPYCRMRGWRTEFWQWLWPQWRLRRSYPLMAIGFLLVIASQIGFWMLLDDVSMIVLISAGTLLLVVISIILLTPPARNRDGSTRGIRLRWCDDFLDRPISIDTLVELRAGYMTAVLLAVCAIGVVPAVGLFLKALPAVEEAGLRQAMAATGRSAEQRIALLTGDLRRNAAPGMQAIGRYPDAVALSRQIAAPGVMRPQPGEAPAPSACSAQSPTMPSAPMQAIWRELLPLLPGQAEALLTLGPDSGFDREAFGGGLGYRHRPRYGAPLLFVDPVCLPSGASLPRLIEAGRGRTGLLISLLLFAMAGVLVHLVVKLVLRRALGIDVPFTPSFPSLGAAYDRELRDIVDGLAPGGTEWWYLLVPAGGQPPDVEQLKQALQPPSGAPVSTVDLGRPGLDWAATRSTMPVLMSNLSRAVLNPVARLETLNLIEQAVARDQPVLVLTAMTPTWPRLCSPQDFPEGERVEAAEAIRWQALRARFAVHHVARDDEMAVLPAMPPIADRRLKLMVEDELIALRELVGRPLAGTELALAQSAPLRDLKDLEDLILSYAEPQFLREWGHCSTAERLVLFHLARGRLPNPLNRRVLDDLLIRRLAVLAPEPRIVCSAFRSFVLRAESPATYAAWAADGAISAWSRIRTPFFIVLMLLVAWFAYSFGEAFSTVDAVLAGTLGVFATIGKVTNLARGASAAEK